MGLQNNIATIANGATDSDIMQKGFKDITKIFVERFNSGATLFITGSKDGVTFYNIQTHTPGATTPNNVISFALGTSNFLISLPPFILSEISFIRFVSNAPIADAAGALITVF